MQGNQSNLKQSLGIMLSIVTLFIGAVLSNLRAVELLLSRWMKFDENLGHGLPLFALTLFFLVIAAKKLELRAGISIVGSVALLGALPLSIIVNHYDVLVAQQILVWIILCLGYITIFKTDSVIPSLFPLGLFIFLIPVWDLLVPILAGITAIVVEFSLQFTGIVAYIDGRHIELPFGVITVADACSGVRYVTIGLALSYLSAFTLPLNFAVRIKIILFGLLLSVIANWIRVFVIVLVGYYSEMESELVADHELFGFILFFALISPILFYKSTKQGEDSTTNKLIFNFIKLFNVESRAIKHQVKLLMFVVTCLVFARLI